MSIRRTILAAGLAAFISASSLAQQVDVSVRIDLSRQLRSDLARVSQIIIPQSGGSRGFVLEQRGQAIEITAVEARVNMLDRTARTQMEIALHNPGSQQIEAILLLPVPDGAVVSNFMFEGASSEPTAQIMLRDEARRLYESIVNRVRDPALLEFAGYNLIRSSVFPVAAGGTQKVRLTYENLLGGDGDRVDYVLPRSESLDRRSPWKITIDIQSQQEIASAYSPSHEIITERMSKNHLRLTLAESSRTDPGAFMLSYLVAKLNGSGLAASMFAYPDPKVGVDGRGGYFLLMAGLPSSITDAAQKMKREVTIVIDRSGSMAGVKMDQAKAAALQVVEGLENGEHFNIIDYSTTVASFAPKPVEKTDESRLAARRYIEAIRPSGGTNIHDALVEALRPDPTANLIPIVLFLTDGLPTVGNTSEAAIRELAEKGNPHHRRIFAFGVGNDVNVPLLDRIADVTRASTTYVLPEENVELKVAAVFKRLYGPVMSDITIETLDGDGAVSTQLVRDLIPSKIPDLFEDDQLILLGQHATGKPVKFRLRGNYLGKERVFEMGFDFDGATTRNAFVPRLWAARRIAYLVDQIRQAGGEFANRVNAAGTSIFDDPKYRELSEEVLRLSTEFGILTEYTAFLATEGTNLNDWERLSAGCSASLDSRAVQQRWGAAAVNQGINFNDQKGQSKLNYGNCYIDANLNAVEFANVQQVCDRAFYKRGEQWIDSQIVASQAEAQKGGALTQNEAVTPDQVIEYGSPEHFALLEQLVQQNRQGVLSLSGDILIVHEGKSILVRSTAPQK